MVNWYRSVSRAKEDRASGVVVIIVSFLLSYAESGATARSLSVNFLD
jgi:hypothetical protein